MSPNATDSHDTPKPDADEEPITRHTPFRTALRSAAEKPLGEIHKNMDGVRSGDDVEALHDLRVATRRLRAVLSVVEPVYPGKAVARLTKTVADMTDHLGEARDTDVFIEFLEKEIASIDDGRAYERVGVEAFCDSLRQLRADQQKELEAAIAHVDADALRAQAEAVFEGGGDKHNG